MLKKKALKKIFMTTLTMFIIITVYTIPVINSSQNVLRTSLELEDITNLPTSKILLKDKNNYLVKVDVFLDGKTEEEKIDKIIDYLTISNDKIPINLEGYIPKNTKILDLKLESQLLTINFSKEFLNTKEEEVMITGLTYSLLELSSIKEIYLSVEGKPLQNYPHSLDKKIGINKKYDLDRRDSINKVVIYYLENYEDSTYYVPITKYLNDEREKIEIIIDELKNPKEKKLVSMVSNNLDLLDYYEENNILFLDFNDKLITENNDVYEKVMNTISYSVFENYDVNMIMFLVNHEKVEYRKR